MQREPLTEGESSLEECSLGSLIVLTCTLYKLCIPQKKKKALGGAEGERQTTESGENID